MQRTPVSIDAPEAATTGRHSFPGAMLAIHTATVRALLAVLPIRFFIFPLCKSAARSCWTEAGPTCVLDNLCAGYRHSMPNA